MIFGNIERLEVVIVILDIRTAGDLKAHSPKHIDDFIQHQSQRMSPAPLPARTRKRDVDFLLFEGALFGLFFDDLQAFVQMLLDDSPQSIEFLASLRPFFYGQICEAPQKER